MPGWAGIDLWELNEAFASVVLRFMEGNVDHDNINVMVSNRDGAPIGATAHILGTALDELDAWWSDRASNGIGGGMGTATIERL